VTGRVLSSDDLRPEEPTDEPESGELVGDRGGNARRPSAHPPADAHAKKKRR